MNWPRCWSGADPDRPFAEAASGQLPCPALSRQEVEQQRVALAQHLRLVAPGQLPGDALGDLRAERRTDRDLAEVAPHALRRLPERLAEQRADAARPTR